MMILPQWRLLFNNILHAFTIKQHSLAAKILKRSNLQAKIVINLISATL